MSAQVELLHSPSNAGSGQLTEAPKVTVTPRIHPLCPAPEDEMYLLARGPHSKASVAFKELHQLKICVHVHRGNIKITVCTKINSDELILYIGLPWPDF